GQRVVDDRGADVGGGDLEERRAEGGAAALVRRQRHAERPIADLEDGGAPAVRPGDLAAGREREAKPDELLGDARDQRRDALVGERGHRQRPGSPPFRYQPPPTLWPFMISVAPRPRKPPGAIERMRRFRTTWRSVSAK